MQSDVLFALVHSVSSLMAQLCAHATVALACMHMSVVG